MPLPVAVEPPPLAGEYLLITRMASEAKVPVIGRTRSTTVSHAAARIVRDGDGYVLEQRVCDVTVEGGGALATTLLPDAFVAALPATRHRVDLAPDGAGGWDVRIDLGESAVGYDPAVSATLPEGADDPAVRDTDGDGRPGATVELKVVGVGTFGIDVVQRAHARLVGHVTEDGVVGTVETVRLEQRVIGADHRMLRTSPAVSPDDARSGFSLVRQPPDAVACAAAGDRGP